MTEAPANAISVPMIVLTLIRSRKIFEDNNNKIIGDNNDKIAALPALVYFSAIFSIKALNVMLKIDAKHSSDVSRLDNGRHTRHANGNTMSPAMTKRKVTNIEAGIYSTPIFISGVLNPHRIAAPNKAKIARVFL
jgi:hypothetical protein